MAGAPLRIGLLGACGLVGRELLALLGERRFPVAELRAFGQGESLGEEVELGDEAARVEAVDAPRVMGCDLLFCAAPGALEALLPALREVPTRVIDLSGALELDPAVPLVLGDGTGLPVGGRLRWIAIPRGAAAAVALALRALPQELRLERVSVVTLESASGLGRAGSQALSDQTVELLNAMTGEATESEVFPRPLAFDCIPLVGELLESGESSEEARLRHVLRRVLDRPALRVEGTRVRVPTFSGSLACVHARFAGEIDAASARELWEKSGAPLRILDEGELPTPRDAASHVQVVIGRVRGGGASLAFCAAVDDLRRGSALTAVRAAELWLQPGP